MPHKEHLAYLRNIPLFAGCSDKDLEHIAKASDVIEMNEGDIIVTQGQTGREAFIILDGAVVITRNDQKVATLDRGDMIGELSLLDHGPRTATATAGTKVKLLVLGQRNLWGVMEQVPSIAQHMLASLATRIRELDRAAFG